MKIRNQITLRFILIVAIIIFSASVLIYVFSADYREDEFYSRLRNKANNTTKLLIEVDEIGIDLLTRLENDNPISLPNERIIIFDLAYKVLFSTDHTKTIDYDSALLARILQDEEIRFRKGDFEVLGFVFPRGDDRFVVLAAATDVYGIRKLSNLRNILMGVFALSILGVSISGWFFSGKALQPISGVVKQVDDITISSLNLRVDTGNGKDEIAQLAMTFNRMLERLEKSFSMQKTFIANASHEFRTPLTAITGQLEVTLLNKRSADDYERVIHSVLDDIRHLNALSNRLLMLAHTNSDEPMVRLVPLRVDELVWQVREELLRHNPVYIIQIDIDYQFDDEMKLTIHGDEQLLKALLANLMDNGCKYSPDKTVSVLIRPTAGGLLLKFEDHGIGIHPDDQKGIFEPFYRGRNTQGIKGHGIGLSMVYRIAALHRGTIRLQSTLGQGTVLTLELFH
jgi:signal transduction histidine kinase